LFLKGTPLFLSKFHSFAEITLFFEQFNYFGGNLYLFAQFFAKQIEFSNFFTKYAEISQNLAKEKLHEHEYDLYYLRSREIPKNIW
jgi:hypothetical protein